MIEIILVLALPVIGAAVLALVGHRSYAGTVNAAASLCTLIAAVALTLRVIDSGPLLALGDQFPVDPFNLFLVALTAFGAFTPAVFSRPYMQTEPQPGRPNPPDPNPPASTCLKIAAGPFPRVGF